LLTSSISGWLIAIICDFGEVKLTAIGADEPVITSQLGFCDPHKQKVVRAIDSEYLLTVVGDIVRIYYKEDLNEPIFVVYIRERKKPVREEIPLVYTVLLPTPREKEMIEEATEELGFEVEEEKPPEEEKVPEEVVESAKSAKDIIAEWDQLMKKVYRVLDERRQKYYDILNEFAALLSELADFSNKLIKVKEETCKYSELRDLCNKLEKTHEEVKKVAKYVEEYGVEPLRNLMEDIRKFRSEVEKKIVEKAASAEELLSRFTEIKKKVETAAPEELQKYIDELRDIAESLDEISRMAAEIYRDTKLVMADIISSAAKSLKEQAEKLIAEIEEKIEVEPEKEIAKEFEKFDAWEEPTKEILKRLIAIREALDEFEKEVEQKPSIERLNEIEQWITKTMDEIQKISAQLTDYRDTIRKTAERLKEKFPEKERFIEDLERIYLDKFAIDSKLNVAGNLRERLYKLLEKVRITKKEVEEKPKVEEVMKQIKEMEERFKKIHEIVKSISDRVEQMSLQEIETVLKSLNEIKPEVRKMVSKIGELLDQIPEKTEEYEEAYDIWSYAHFVEDLLNKTIKKLEEQREKLKGIGLTEEELKSILERIRTKLSIERLEELAAELPWDRMTEEQKRIVQEAIEKRRKEILYERKLRSIFDLFMELINRATTEEELDLILNKLEASPLSESMKQTLRNEIERRRAELRKEVTPPTEVVPPKPERPPEIQAEIEALLNYLKVQKQFGMKRHWMIEQALKRLRELGYERIEEVESWFPPEVPPVPPTPPEEVAPPAPPARPPEVEAEIEKELHYLRTQKQLGMKMHDQIRRSIERLRELRYPEERIREIEEWFK